MSHDEDNNAGSKQKFIMISIINLIYDYLKNMFANFKAIGHTIFICDVPSQKPSVIVYAGEMLDFLLCDSTRK